MRRKRLRARSQEEPEDEAMRDEKRWDDGRRDEERATQRPGVKPNAEPLIERVQEIGRAPDVEHPYEANGHAEAPDQRDGSDDREHRGPEVSVRRGSGPRPRQGG